MNTENQIPFKKKHTLQQRIEKAKKQLAGNPGKVLVIVQKHRKSILPNLDNPRYKLQYIQISLLKRL